MPIKGGSFLDVNGKEAKARIIQEHVSLEPITRSRAKEFQKELELFIAKTPTHLEELEFKVKELKPKLIILLTCLEGQS